MAGEWRETTIAEFAPFTYGKGLPERQRNTNGKIPVYGSNGVVGFHDAPLTDGPTVIIGRKGTVGSIHYSPVPCWPIDTTFFITSSDSTLLRYRYFLLKALGLEHMNSDSAVPGLNRDAAHSRRVRVPLDKDEQRAIACILGALDDKIELNRRMNRTLEEMARAIFKSWFVDFDPVRAKAAGHHPPGLKPEIAALFPDAFEDSEQGEIPVGWRTSPIGDAVQVVGGGTPSTKEPAYWEEGIHPFCTPKDMSSLADPVLLATERHLTDAGLAKVSSGQLPVGTVLLSSRAPIGYLAVAETPVSVNQGIIAMVCDGELPNLYVLHWTKANMDRVLANANGSTFMEISKRNFRPITVVIPPPQVLRCFMQVVDPTHQRVESSLKQIQHLANLRDSLLPKLISGEIIVAEAERIAGRAI